MILLSRAGELSGGAIAILAEVAKARGGVPGVCHLRFNGVTQTWEETSERPIHNKADKWEP